jgi:hypothetical protein
MGQIAGLPPQRPVLTAAPVPFAGMPGPQQAGLPALPAMPVPAAEPDFMGSRIPISPMSRGNAVPTGAFGTEAYASNPGGMVDITFGMDSLANRPARRIGRSMNDPMRQLEQSQRFARVDGDYGAAAQIAGHRAGLMGQQAQHVQQAQQQAQERQDRMRQWMVTNYQHEQGRQDRADFWGADAAERQRQADLHWQQQMTMFGLNQGADAMKTERERQQQEADRNRTPNVGATPVPGSGYVIPTADGRPMGVVPAKGEAPKGPTPEDISNHIDEMHKRGVKASYGPNGWSYVRHDVVPTVKVLTDTGKMMDFPADHELPPGWKVLTKKGEKGAAAPPKETSGGGAKPSSFLNF